MVAALILILKTSTKSELADVYDELRSDDSDADDNIYERQAKKLQKKAMANLKATPEYEDGAYVGYIAMLAVKDSYRGQGIGSNLELTNADNEYKTAQTNYLNTLYKSILSKIDLLKATGTLYNTKL